MAKPVKPHTRPTSGWTIYGISAVLAAITWLVFGRTLGHGFINYDDEIYVYENPQVVAGLTLHGVIWAFTHTVSANWHPLTVISHMLDCQLFGLNAGGHHFTNVFLHTIAVLLLFLVTRQMTGATWQSAFVAALFAIHPLHVESVAWIAERKDVLSAVFFMLTLVSYLRYASRPSFGRYVTMLILFVCGLMAKPMLVTLPFVLLLLDYWPLKRFAVRALPRSKVKDHGEREHPCLWWRLVLEKIPLLLLSTASCVTTFLAQRHFVIPIDNLPLPWRIGNAVVATMVYMLQLMLPFRLSVFYPHPRHSLSVGAIALSVVLLIAISIGGLILKQKRPYLLIGWLWYLGMLIPVIGLVQVGIQAHADRYTYLPQIGLYLAVTWFVADMSMAWRYRQPILGVATTIVLLVLIPCAWRQTSYWRDSLSLWTHALTVNPDNDTAHTALSDVFLREGRPELAVRQAEMALSIRPDSADAHSKLALALSRSGQQDRALVHFQKVLQTSPNRPYLHYNLATVFLKRSEVDEAIANLEKELEIQPDYAAAHNNLGAALIRKGQLDEALIHFQKALEIDPRLPMVHYNIAKIFQQKGQWEQAFAEYQKRLQIQPDDADTYNDLGIAFSQKGKMNEALVQWQKTLELQPNNINAQCNLAWVFATYPEASIRDGVKAVDHAQRALQLSGGKDPRIFRVLAAAYAENGRFAEAIETAQRGFALAVGGDSALAETLQTDMSLYRTRVPLRDTSGPEFRKSTI